MSIGAVVERLEAGGRVVRRLLSGALGRIKLIVLGRKLCHKVNDCCCVKYKYKNRTSVGLLILGLAGDPALFKKHRIWRRF